jgi:hypothetical protein
MLSPLIMSVGLGLLVYDFHRTAIQDIREQVTQATALVEAHMARQDADAAQILACQDRIVKHEEEILAAIHERKLGGLMSKRRQPKQSAEQEMMDDWFNAK